MIITNPDGTKVSSENVDRKGTPKFKCPKCGCLYFSFSDIASFFKGGDKAVTVCNECGTELEFCASPDNNQ